METSLVPGSGVTARPVAHWVQEPDGRGGTRLVMKWTLLDLDAALARLAATADA